MKNKLKQIEEALVKGVEELMHDKLAALVAEAKYFLGKGRYDVNCLRGKRRSSHVNLMWDTYQKLYLEVDWCTGQDLRLFERAITFDEEDVICLEDEAKSYLWDFLPEEFVLKDEATDFEKEREKQWFLCKVKWKGIGYIVYVGGKPIVYMPEDSAPIKTTIKINTEARI